MYTSPRRCAGTTWLWRPRPLHHHRCHRARRRLPPGGGWSLVCAVALLRARGEFCASAPSATATISGPGRASSRRPQAMLSTTPRSSSGSLPTVPCSRSREIAYDPWNATHIALRLQDEGAAMVEFRQGFRSMGSADAPAQEADRLEKTCAWRQPGDPVRMAANVAVAQDPAGNLKPAKDKSTERIDGIVATIMAIGRALVAQHQPQPVYDVLCLTRWMASNVAVARAPCLQLKPARNSSTERYAAGSNADSSPPTRLNRRVISLSGYYLLRDRIGRQPRDRVRGSGRSRAPGSCAPAMQPSTPVFSGLSRNRPSQI